MMENMLMLNVKGMEFIHTLMVHIKGIGKMEYIMEKEFKSTMVFLLTEMLE